MGFLNPLHCLWAPLSHFSLLEYPWPICLPWASLAHFLILHSHEFLLTLLGFPGPITLFFILGAHGLSTNPLLSYFIISGLLRPILTFLHLIIPMSLLLLSLGSFRPVCFPWASLAHFLTLHSHELLLTLLGFPDPITLFFILGAHGLSTNPLLSYFITSGLLRPILTFLHLIIPMSLLLLSLGSFRPVCFP